jgi:hypothetical protein
MPAKSLISAIDESFQYKKSKRALRPVSLAAQILAGVPMIRVQPLNSDNIVRVLGQNISPFSVEMKPPR